MKTILTALLCAVCLTGCGKRGKLDFPEGATYPRQYPAPRNPKTTVRPETARPEQRRPQSALEVRQLLETEE